MTTFAVLGAGMMGRIVAKEFLRADPDAFVTLLDSREDLLQDVAREIEDGRLRTQSLDIRDRGRSAELLRGHSAAVAALPHARSSGSGLLFLFIGTLLFMQWLPLPPG